MSVVSKPRHMKQYIKHISNKWSDYSINFLYFEAIHQTLSDNKSFFTWLSLYSMPGTHCMFHYQCSASMKASNCSSVISTCGNEQNGTKVAFATIWVGIVERYKKSNVPSGKQWNIPILNRKYIFNPGPFSIAMLDYLSVNVMLMFKRHVAIKNCLLLSSYITTNPLKA